MSEPVTQEISADIDAWVDHTFAVGEQMPDFWDELNTSERLGEWLAALGYSKARGETP